MDDKSNNNAKLAYEYTKVIWETTVVSYDTVTAKLTTALGFSGLLLRFAADLSNDEWLVVVKLGVCILLSISIVCCCTGLWPQSSGKELVPPDDFIDKEKGVWYEEDEGLSYLYISRGLNDETKKIREKKAFRLTCLTIAITFIGIASIGFAISIGGGSIIAQHVENTQRVIVDQKPPPIRLQETKDPKQGKPELTDSITSTKPNL